jgi:hypothetical protein
MFLVIIYGNSEVDLRECQWIRSLITAISFPATNILDSYEKNKATKQNTVTLELTTNTST